VSIFFKGCPLKCSWCHNPEGIEEHIEHFTEERSFDGITIQEDITIGRYVDVEELCSEIEKERVFMEETGGGVTFSGGEPLLQHEFIAILAEEMSKRDIHTCLDTSGYVPEKIFRASVDKFDLFLYDLKIMDDHRHRKYTGVSNRIILRNLEILNEAKSEVIVRIPFVPGINDSEQDTRELLDYLLGLDHIRNVDILPYHSWARNKYRRFKKENLTEDIAVPENNQLDAIRSLFYQSGFNQDKLTKHEPAN